MNNPSNQPMLAAFVGNGRTVVKDSHGRLFAEWERELAPAELGAFMANPAQLFKPAPASTVQNMLHWALGELLGALPERRDWLNPEAEKVLRAALPAPAATTCYGATRADQRCPCPTCSAEREPGVLSDAEFLSKRLGRVAKLAGVTMPGGTHEQIAEVAGSVLGSIAFAMERAAAHPVAKVGYMPGHYENGLDVELIDRSRVHDGMMLYAAPVAGGQPVAWMLPREIAGLVEAAAKEPTESRLYGRVYAHQYDPSMVRVCALPTTTTGSAA